MSKILITDDMSHIDIAYEILKQSEKHYKIPELFKEICALKNYTDKQYEDKVGDFYTDINNDKRFVSLPNGFWDIRDRHSIELTLEEDEEDLEIDAKDLEDDMDALEEDINELEEDLLEDDMDGLTIIDDELEEE